MTTETNRPLWAPWRITFIRSPRENGCFLCGNEIPDAASSEEELIVGRGRTAFAMLNRYPYNSGHLLIAPYRHIDRLAGLTAEERAELMELAARAETVLTGVLKPDAFNVGFNLGRAAGAGIADHLHLHVVPRWVGDTNFMPVIADTRCVPEALTDTAQLIRQNW